jgi:hypothetical protein
MTRAALTYNERREHRTFEGFDPDTPVAGHYRFRMRSGGVSVGVRIVYGPPHDPVTGEEMDRGWRWQAFVNEALTDMARVWPACADTACTADEYRYLCTLQDWGAANGHVAIADPRKRLDPLDIPQLF